MVYNFDFDIAAVIISFFAIVLSSSKKVFEKKQNRILFMLLCIVFLGSIFDILSVVENTFREPLRTGLRDIFDYGYLFLQNSIPLLFSLYMVALMEIDEQVTYRKIFYFLLGFPTFMEGILLLVNPFFHCVFYYDEEGIYRHGATAWFFYASAILYLLANCGMILRYGQRVTLEKRATVYIYIISCLGAIVLQILFPTMLLQMFFDAICLSGILYTVENRNEILHRILLYVLLFFMAVFSEMKLIPQIFPLRGLENFYFLILLMILMISFGERLADRGKIRRYLITCVWLMVLIMVLRIARFEVFSSGSSISRYLWYWYYFPILFLGFFTIMAVLSVEEGKSLWKKGAVRISLFITVVLFLLILTNDFHQMVFRYPEGLEQWESACSYTIIYHLILLWNFLNYLVALFLMIQKCKVTTAKKVWWLTLVPFLLGAFIIVLIGLNIIPIVNNNRAFEFPELTCFMVALFWECCICIGLLPINKGYGKLVEICSLAIQIGDRDGNMIYQSRSCRELSENQKRIPGVQMLDENTVLVREEIPGGYSFWQEDITELNNLNEELEEIQSRLSEEGELIRLENELKEKQVSITQRNRIYDTIAQKTLPQSKKIEDLAHKAMECTIPAKKNDYAGEICVLGAYIKRYANLVLLSEKDEMLSCKELGMALAESLRYLGNTGIPTDCCMEAERNLLSGVVLCLYEIFEEILESCLNSLKGISVIMTEAPCFMLKITMEGVMANLSQEQLAKLRSRNIEAEMIGEEEICYLRFRYKEESGL